MRITDALSLSSQSLKIVPINSYLLESLILMGHCLGFSKEQVIFHKNLSLNPEQLAHFFSLVKRREKREPISHLIGRREFFGTDFIVSGAVLDPRPDSEILIETVEKHFQDKRVILNILELGLGSACLTLSILKIFVNSFATGLDIDKDALLIATQNSNLLGLNSRCHFIQSDWFKELESGQKFDLIISNPPYIATSDIDFLQEEVRNYEPRIALNGGDDGLDCYRQIAQNVANFLKDDGILVLEIGQDQEKSVTQIFTAANLKLIASNKDLAGIVRCLLFEHRS